MPDAADSVARWLPQARSGSKEALGQLLESCRAYLLMVAEKELDPDLRAKGGASDLVQETFLEAQRDFARFTGATEAELLAWLRRLLLNNLANFTRGYRETQKRAVGREVQVPGGASSAEVGQELPGTTPTPSDVVMEREQAEAVRAALGRLPEDYRQVLLLRHQEGLSFEEIALRMGRSANAVQKLWVRAVEQVQQELGIRP
jgi:RNA polymerase sigma-70 factor (ECF subfamily)